METNREKFLKLVTGHDAGFLVKVKWRVTNPSILVVTYLSSTANGTSSIESTPKNLEPELANASIPF